MSGQTGGAEGRFVKPERDAGPDANIGEFVLMQKGAAPGGARRRRKMFYTYADIAELRGVTVYAVRRAVSRGVLDPKDLWSVCRYIRKEKGGLRKDDGKPC